MKPEKQRVIMIDDDLEEAQNHIDLLMIDRDKETIEFILRSPEHFKQMSDYLKLIQQTDASAIIIDQRLGEKSSAGYNGLELANKLRNPLPMFPIFILTKYATSDRLEAEGGSLDDIMEKRDFHKKSGIYMARLLRAMGRFKETSSVNRKRMDFLMQEGFDRPLSQEEKSELNALRSELMWLTFDGHLDKSSQLQEDIDLRQELLDRLKNPNY